MSSLFARTKPAGRDGVRCARSKHIGDIDDASVTFGSSRVSTDRSFHLLRPASSWAIRRATSLAGRFQIKSTWRLPAGCTRRPTSSSAKRCGQTCWPRPPRPVSAASAPAARRAMVWAYDGPFGHASAARSHRSLGVSPSHAAKSRPDLNVSGGGAFMLSIDDPIGQTPGIVAIRLLMSSSRCHFISLASIFARRARTAAYSSA